LQYRGEVRGTSRRGMGDGRGGVGGGGWVGVGVWGRLEGCCPGVCLFFWSCSGDNVVFRSGCYCRSFLFGCFFDRVVQLIFRVYVAGADLSLDLFSSGRSTPFCCLSPGSVFLVVCFTVSVWASLLLSILFSVFFFLAVLGMGFLCEVGFSCHIFSHSSGRANSKPRMTLQVIDRNERMRLYQWAFH